MSVALWCVLVAALLPLMTTGIAKYYGSKISGRRFDNANPRAWQERQTGLPARAHGAHLNGFEAFPLFAVAVLIAEMKGAPHLTIDLLAVFFIVARIVYVALYLADLDRLRSLVWLIGLAIAIAIFSSPAWSR